MCGKTFRHDGSPPENAELSIRYSNIDDEDTYDPKNVSKYQNREQFWYGVAPVPNKNYLARQFNRFNFFNTDASFRLSSKEASAEIWDGFESLALGGKASELGRRIDGFDKRFRKAHSDLTKVAHATELEVADLKFNATELKNSMRPPEFDAGVHAKVLDLITTRRWPTNGNTTHFREFKSFLDSVRIPLEAAIDGAPSVSPFSAVNLRSEISRARAAIAELKLFENIQASSKQQITATIERQAALDLRLVQVEKLNRYCKDELAFNIEKFEKSIVDLEREISTLKIQSKTIHSSDLFPTEDGDRPIHATIQRLLDSRIHALAEFQRADKKLSQVKDGFESIKSIVQDIKGLGRRFLDSASNHQHCPMCETQFARDELERRISRIEVGEDELVRAVEVKSQADLVLGKIDFELAMLQRIYLALSELLPTDHSSLSINEARNILSKLTDQANAKLAVVSQNRKIIVELKRQGFSAGELQELLKSLNIHSQAPAQDVSDLVLKIGTAVSGELVEAKMKVEMLTAQVAIHQKKLMDSALLTGSFLKNS